MPSDLVNPTQLLKFFKNMSILSFYGKNTSPLFSPFTICFIITSFVHVPS